MIERYSKTRDLTAVQNPNGSGMSMRKMCFTCRRPRPDEGGRTDKRTRMWSCGSCNAPPQREPE